MDPGILANCYNKSTILWSFSDVDKSHLQRFQIKVPCAYMEGAYLHLCICGGAKNKRPGYPGLHVLLVLPTEEWRKHYLERTTMVATGRQGDKYDACKSVFYQAVYLFCVPAPVSNRTLWYFMAHLLKRTQGRCSFSQCSRLRETTSLSLQKVAWEC